MKKKKNQAHDYHKEMSPMDRINNYSLIEVGSSVFPKYEDNPKGAFLPGNGRVRPQPHKMINECDH